MIVYEKGDLLYIFNFHYENSYDGYQIGTRWKTDHFIVLESDEERFGGFKRLDDARSKWVEVYPGVTWQERKNCLKIYIPARTCIVLCPLQAAMETLAAKPDCGLQMPPLTARQK